MPSIHPLPTAAGPAGAPLFGPGRLADFHRHAQRSDPVFQDWLQPWHDALFGWTLARVADAEGRRALAGVAVAIQRLRGTAEMQHWVVCTALQAAARQCNVGGLPEAWLAGLPPELRALLRLVARGALAREEAQGLLTQRLGQVRRRLVQARLVPDRPARPGRAPFPSGQKSVWLMDQDFDESFFMTGA